MDQQEGPKLSSSRTSPLLHSTDPTESLPALPASHSCASSYFGLYPSPEIASSSRRSPLTYHPRQWRAQDAACAASSSPIFPQGSVRSTMRPEGIDNWDRLEDMLEEHSGSSQQLPNKPMSLRGMFTPSPSSPRLETVRANSKAVPIVPRQSDSALGLFSSSPSQMYNTGLGSIEQEMDEPVQPASPEQVEEELDDLQTQGSQTSVLISKDDGRTDPPPRPPNKVPRQWWPPPPWVIAIVKCSLAYFLASLFTFVPTLARILSTSSETDAHGRVTPRPSYSAHMLATIVVYFNPAKTLGNMTLALRFCLILAVFATSVSLMAMGTIALFDNFSPSHGSKWDWISEMGDWIVCVLWIGGSMGGLAWSKVWVNNPSFNSGCSMAAMILYTVVIKEGAMPKLLEILLIVSIGSCLTALVCVLVFPMSATTRLQDSISNSVTSFSTLLDLLTSTFLLEKSVLREKRTSLKDAIQAHAATFKGLQANLAEARHERVFDTRVRGRRLSLYEAAIGSLGRLAQHLAGLRSSTRLQESLIRASREGKLNLELVARRGQAVSMSMVQPTTSPGPGGWDSDVDIAASVRLFMSFRRIAGESMNTLVDRCDDALECVEAVAHSSNLGEMDLDATRSSLATSLKEFNKSSSRAIKRLYAGPRREKGIYEEDGDSDSDDTEIIDLAETAHGPNETVFFVYFFLFTLEEFSRELLFLLDTMNEILFAEQVSTLDHVRSLFKRRRSDQSRPQYLYKQLQQLVPIDPSKTQPPLFPKNRPDTQGALRPLPSRSLTLLGKIKKAFWGLGDRLAQPDMKYAIKVALAGAILAAPAYTEIGRPIFLRYRGEWALIAFFATMSPTVGQTNFLSFFRVIGTLLGASVAILFYSLFPGNAIVLPILGFFFSLPCFYVITQMPDYAAAGRFILLTYNLSCLYVYNSRQREDEFSVTVTSIAFHRSTSVIIGVVWAAIVSRYWWPFTARRELRMGVSDFCLDLSYLYSKLVATYSRGVDIHDFPPTSNYTSEESEPLLPVGSPRSPHLNPGVRQFMAMELHLQSQLVDLRKLLNDTKTEPRLKGPFAFDFYREVLLSCERMLDRLHSMRCVTTRDEWDNGIRAAFVVPVNRQRREMAGSVILYFYVLSAGFRLRTPMPPYLPPAEKARQALVGAIRQLDVVKRRSVRGGGRHLLFFAYALAMQEVIAELDYLGSLMQDAFGVINQPSVDDFESLFETAPSP